MKSTIIETKSKMKFIVPFKETGLGRRGRTHQESLPHSSIDSNTDSYQLPPIQDWVHKSISTARMSDRYWSIPCQYQQKPLPGETSRFVKRKMYIWCAYHDMWLDHDESSECPAKKSDTKNTNAEAIRTLDFSCIAAFRLVNKSLKEAFDGCSGWLQCAEALKREAKANSLAISRLKYALMNREFNYHDAGYFTQPLRDHANRIVLIQTVLLPAVNRLCNGKSDSWTPLEIDSYTNYAGDLEERLRIRIERRNAEEERWLGSREARLQSLLTRYSPAS